MRASRAYLTEPELLPELLGIDGCHDLRETLSDRLVARRTFHRRTYPSGTTGSSRRSDAASRGSQS
ncbi:hypothetical protein Ais01nite_75860 [Asanoa ishikariensis]|uniref:Uncharacterized protein n=1 Tax=Asanoa ishikariensis TaxID=137265 RepID=A0A1H3L224_9ACTN|nr:hypothetical protein Ais01nite_75860 [Asanoa ishikariensis]SDY58400.1 hypothetical protein SAMN05421684_0483 [Asanoa ishikariensis]